MEPDLRRLDAARVSQMQDSLQASGYAPQAHGVAPGARGSQPQRSPTTSMCLAGSPMPSPAQTNLFPTVSAMPSPSLGNTFPGARMRSLTPTRTTMAPPREVKVEVVSAPPPAAASGNGALEAGEKQLLQLHGETIRLLQAELKQLRQSQSVNEAERAQTANADRVSIEIELKDLRVHVDSQGKLQQARLENIQAKWATGDAELKHVKDMILGQPPVDSISAELTYLCESVKAQEVKVANLETQLHNLQQLVDEDRGQLNIAIEQVSRGRPLWEASAIQAAQTAEQMATLGNVPEMQEQLVQQGVFIRDLQTECVGLSRALSTTQAVSKDTSLSMDSLSELQRELQSLRAGSDKNHADLTLKQSALSKDVSDLRVQLSGSPASDAETKELRKLVETKFAQQEQGIQALRRDVGSLDETTQELKLPPSGAGSSLNLHEVDALKQEVAEQRKLQASELRHEADDLYKHLNSVVSMEREARTEEITRFNSKVDLLRSELSTLSESLRLGAHGSMGSTASTPLIAEQFECINPKLDRLALDATTYIGLPKK